jgi:L-serine deaminase
VTSEEVYLPGRLRVRRRAKNLYQKLTRGFYPADFKQRLSSDTALQRAEPSKDLLIGQMDHPLAPIKPRRVSFPTMDMLSCWAIAVNEMNAGGSRIVVGSLLAFCT